VLVNGGVAPIEKVMYKKSHTVCAMYNDMKNGLILKNNLIANFSVLINKKNKKKFYCETIILR
jgi:hypothetical protein